MSAVPWWHYVLLVLGTLCMLLGAVDPLEGSVIILPGVAMVALEAFLGGSRFARLLARAAALVGLGIAVLFGLSAFGGVGGATGLPVWTALFLLPYPVGWVMGLVGVFRRFRELRKV